MFERMFNGLFRLYPARFREVYGEEARRLLHERFRDETGCFRRSRLCIDLLIDFAAGLPQAWCTTPKTAATSLIPQRTPGVPSFHVLDQEKTRAGPFLAGSVISLTALGIFSSILSDPQPYKPLSGSETRRSPIEAVLERLNGPPSANEAGNPRPEAGATTGTPIPTPQSPSRKLVITARPSSARAAVAMLPAEQPRRAVEPVQNFAAFRLGVYDPSELITGVWRGVLLNSQHEFPTVVTIAEGPSGALHVTFQCIGQEPKPLTATLPVYQDGELKFTVPSIRGRYAGKISPDGKSISGTWWQTNNLQLLLLRREP